MTDPLTEFEQAIEAGDEQQAVSTAADVLDETDRRSERERGVETAARIVATDPTQDDTAQAAARDLIRKIQSIEGIRATLDQHILGLANGLFDAEDLLSTISDLRSARSELQTAVTAFRETEAAQSLDPILLVLVDETPIELPVGDSVDQTLELVNAGGTPATDVEIRTEGEFALTADPVSLNTVDPRTTVPVELSSPPTTEAGTFSVQLVVTDDSGETAVQNIRTVVLQTDTYLRDAIIALNELEDRIVTLLEEHRRTPRPFQNRIEKIRADIESLRSQSSDRGGQRPITKRIDRQLKWLNGLEGLVSSLNQVSDSVRTSLLTEIESIREQLRDARRAASG